jgi:type II secretory pathway pseudopilin PulG
MKNKGIIVIVIILTLAGIGFISYPTVSNWLYTRNATQLISDYNQEVSRYRSQGAGICQSKSIQ